MSNFQKKQQVRPETNVRKVNGSSQGMGGTGSRSEGLVSFYATADLPTASGLPNGVFAYDTTSQELKMTVSGNWEAM